MNIQHRFGSSPPIEASKIAPKLWMGSRPPPGPYAGRMFDVLVLCAGEYQPMSEWYPGCEVLRIDLDDAELSAGHALAASHLGAQIAKRIRLQKRVLVTCNQGRNRSGLVTALALTHLTGSSGADAANAVRMRRQSPYGPALTNDHYLRALYDIPAALVRGFQSEMARMAAGLAG